MSRPRERASVDECRVLDVNEMNRRGHLPKPPKDETWIEVQVRNCRQQENTWELGCAFVRSPPWEVLLTFG